MQLGSRILHFVLGERRYGVRLADIREIREIQAVTSVPGAPEVIAGLTDVRGRIVTLVDLRQLFRVAGSGDPGLFAVQLGEPRSHLGLLVPGRVERVETDASADLAYPDSEETGLGPEASGAGISEARGGEGGLADGEAAYQGSVLPDSATVGGEAGGGPHPFAARPAANGRASSPARGGSPAQPFSLRSAGTAPASSSSASVPSADARDALADRSLADQGEDVPRLGREVVVSRARPVFLIDPEAVARYCIERVRERFRVADEGR